MLCEEKTIRLSVKCKSTLKKYKEAKQDLSKPVNQRLVQYSTLQYFEEDLDID